MKSLLITGFQPFLEFDTNPSEVLANKLENLVIGNYKITSRIIPVVYREAYTIVPKLIEEIDPDVVLNLGLAGNRAVITPELVALNYINSKSSDNDKEIIKNQKIIEHAPNAYFSNINWDKAIEKLESMNIPVELSTTAGTYVCNQVSYLFQYEINKNSLSIRQGFIHIPNNLDLELLEKSISVIIENIQ